MSVCTPTRNGVAALGCQGTRPLHLSQPVCLSMHTVTHQKPLGSSNPFGPDLFYLSPGSWRSKGQGRVGQAGCKNSGQARRERIMKVRRLLLLLPLAASLLACFNTCFNTHYIDKAEWSRLEGKCLQTVDKPTVRSTGKELVEITPDTLIWIIPKNDALQMAYDNFDLIFVREDGMFAAIVRDDPGRSVGVMLDDVDIYTRQFSPVKTGLLVSGAAIAVVGVLALVVVGLRNVNPKF